MEWYGSNDSVFSSENKQVDKSYTPTIVSCGIITGASEGNQKKKTIIQNHCY
jgi:hypothetical protein